MKNTINFITEFRNRPYGKAVFFFGFYFILFAVLLFILHSGNNNTTNKVEEEKPAIMDLKYLEKNDYTFEYKVVLDNNIYTYTGKKIDKKFSYIYNSKEYYNEDGKSYIKEEDWKEIENPMKFNVLFDEKKIDEIINSSYSVSRNRYDSGEIVHSLLISSNTLNEIIDDNITDVEENPNSIKVTLNSNKYLSEIDYDLNSYCKSNNLCNSLNVIISYKEFSSNS